MLNPEEYQEARRIFHAAIECTSEDRRAYLDEVCQGRAELRSEVELLLDSDAALGTAGGAGDTAYRYRVMTRFGRRPERTASMAAGFRLVATRESSTPTSLQAPRVERK